MADVIYVRGNRSSLKSAISAIEKNVEREAYLKNGSRALQWSAGTDAFYAGFCAQAVSEINEALNLIDKAYSTLIHCEKYLNEVPVELREIDSKRKNQQSNWLERAVYNDYRYRQSIIHGGSILFITWLFSKNRNTGEEVDLHPYSYLRDRYDWDRSRASEEDIQKAIEEGAKDEKGIGIEQSIDEKLRELYEKTKIIGTKEIKLKHNMGDASLDHNTYSSSGKLCCCMAYAIGLSIVTGEKYNPLDLAGENGYSNTWKYKEHRSDWFHYDGQNTPSEIYKGLKNGEPTMLHYKWSNGNEHWVLIIGVREGADEQDLHFDDFIAIDPSGGKECNLTDCWEFKPERVDGGRFVTK